MDIRNTCTNLKVVFNFFKYFLNLWVLVDPLGTQEHMGSRLSRYCAGLRRVWVPKWSNGTGLGSTISRPFQTHCHPNLECHP
ncbi:hypothetical protein Lalb_Chr18g0051611 [Lupinus albus]|uniref:Uncharacterized protein n=1 Tax=Lupinus albus TaxID=3870 RepID=A0A6A4NQ06_LUPAL|nr:hypothetical protein Lalb_Chr18g0051611 [Lupinus albus]